tara:strand:- start:171 stop:461 length:291 start_codon:yes stop_codon:yes gene_type:complete
MFANGCDDMEIGDLVKNKHTGQIEQIHGIEEVLTYNPSTQQKDAVVVVYILERKNRWNRQLMNEHWEVVETTERPMDNDYLYGVSYEVASTEGEEE